MQKVFLFAAGRLYLLDICDHERVYFMKGLDVKSVGKRTQKYKKGKYVSMKNDRGIVPSKFIGNN